MPRSLMAVPFLAGAVMVSGAIASASYQEPTPRSQTRRSRQESLVLAGAAGVKVKDHIGINGQCPLSTQIGGSSCLLSDFLL